MNDSAVSEKKESRFAAVSDPGPLGWLLLIHQLPADPAYLRVKILRRLKGIGALPLKSSVYVLPDRESCREDFQWLMREITDGGGSATLSSARFLEGVTDAALRKQFHDERDVEYRELAEAARASARSGATRSDLDRMTRALADVRERDHFDAPGRARAERALAELEGALRADRPAEPKAAAARPCGATWVTRSGVFVDRMACAWLIRRFIDPAARFRFVGSSTQVRSGELAFDMFEGGFTHVGDRCTFETLLHHFGIAEPGLAPIAEIVHDIDCKDGKFGRLESAGIASVLRGVAAGHARDEDRIAAAAPVFEGLLAGFGKS